jgi:hypothetical protein
LRLNRGERKIENLESREQREPLFKRKLKVLIDSLYVKAVAGKGKVSIDTR